ncbi:hypothetical protein RRG08_004281 [Elysia crispata]|uniref:Uncharacterized protein n=1 Tax=Elysia crispata TaxID=231223 RepID=A0AAE0YBV9_9GAST|nr:hypothetical protein RRG08_004281 [Elysia crispata]
MWLEEREMTLEDFDKISENNMQNVAFAVKGDHVAWTQVKQFTNFINMVCVHNPILCQQLSFVIGSLRPSVVFGFKGILLIFGIFLPYETRSMRLKQVNGTRFVGMSIFNIVARNKSNFCPLDFYI